MIKSGRNYENNLYIISSCKHNIFTETPCELEQRKETSFHFLKKNFIIFQYKTNNNKNFS